MVEMNTILDNYINGNHSDMRELIRKYGVRDFFYDLIGHLIDNVAESDKDKLMKYERIYELYYAIRK